VNCFVKRRSDTREIVIPTTTAEDMPQGLALRHLADDEGLL
jgi:hypothetical protein